MSPVIGTSRGLSRVKWWPRREGKFVYIDDEDSSGSKGLTDVRHSGNDFKETTSSGSYGPSLLFVSEKWGWEVNLDERET